MLLATWGGGLAKAIAATPVPLQLDMKLAVINWQSQRGVPLSTTVGAGSDGRGPTLTAQTTAGLTTDPATQQFSAFLSLGAVAAPETTTLIAGKANVSGSALSLKLPVGIGNSGVVAVLARAQVGAPYILQGSSYRFGQVITPPPFTETGGELPDNVLASEYWRAEPFTTNNHAGGRYYWSIHARQVFATQPGPVDIAWVKAAPEAVKPSDSQISANPTRYSVQGNYVYGVTNQSVVVSGSAFKPVVSIYWNQQSFSRIGPQVVFPQGSIVGLNLVTNTLFPERVAKGYLLPGESTPMEGETNQFREKRTLWYESTSGSLNAYNLEGRAFIEYYGPRNADGISHKFLGYEIVDVRQKADIVTTAATLGSPLVPAPASLPSAGLVPQPLSTFDFATLVYQLPEAANDPNLSQYWAIEETTAPQQVLMYWMKPASLGILWPVVLDDYSQAWPSDPNAYSHYVRSRADTTELAATTGINLPPGNIPKLVYQDILDRPRAFLSSASMFYTWLTPEYPSVRALLLYKNGPNIFFERVLSWLDTSADSGAQAFASSVTTNLVDLANKTVAGGTGLIGSYWTDQTGAFAGLPDVVLPGSAINFNWDTASPDSKINRNQFSARFEGFVQAQFSETYTFSITGDDGVRVYVNGIKVAEGWVSQGMTEYSGSIALQAGNLYPITVEYFQNTGGAGLQLRWSSASTAKAIIPRTQLYGPYDKVYSPVLPRVVREGVLVGQRILPPVGELGREGTYLAGHVHLATGTSVAADAYIDPLTDGFAAANQGAIIPINAIPGQNLLEVWWFRQNAPPTGKGFTTVYWPSVIGYYTIAWPTSTPNQIILSSNQGSKPLTGLARDGWLYYQNDRSLLGFNPNEEHALLQGGSLWALRDDLNVTTGTNYSSQPYALLEYIESDGRPAMQPFSIAREDVSKGFTFQYEVSVGNNGGLAPILQAPMPLPLLTVPRATPTSRSLNTEVSSINIQGLTTTNISQKFGTRGAMSILQVDMTLGERASLPTHREYVLAGNISGTPTANYWIFLTSADTGEVSPATYKFTGIVSTNRPLAISSVRCPQLDQTVTANKGLYRYFVSSTNLFALNQNVQLWNALTKVSNVATVSGTGSTNIYDINTQVTNTLQFVTVDLKNESYGTNQVSDLVNATDLVWLVPNVTTFTFPSSATAWTLRNSPLRNTPNRSWVSNGAQVSQPDLQQDYAFDVNGITFQDRNGSVWFYRGPHDANDPATTTMRFYYKTLPGFYYPINGSGNRLELTDQPEVGTITPYLRPYSQQLTKFVGDPIYGNTQDTVRGDDNALGISYSTVWSKAVPVLPMGQSLMEAVRGLPGIRGNISARILYQQSRIVKSETNISVVLHDPTRQKVFALAYKTDTAILSKIPNSVSTQDSFGKLYFPNLPPHLVGRVFFDSTVGKYGSLIFRGEFIKAITGDSYLLPNVLSESDRNYLVGLCDPADTERSKWEEAVAGLKTTMIPFHKDKGVWLVDSASAMSATYLPSELCQAVDQDVPVDSYALTAVGPGSGYVALAFQDSLSPAAAKGVLAVQVIQVSTNLYPGEIKIVNASNPLSAYITLQQVVDLAGKAGSYVFDWRMAAPVDGGPVPVKNSGAQPLTSVAGPGDQWLSVDRTKFPDGVRVTLGGTADVQALSDNYLIVRYRTTDTNHPSYGTWSAWTAPQLAEGWIKRVLAGVNPFSQRVTDFNNNEVSDQVSMVSQAGSRWEGNVPLNQTTLNDFGLIPIYETVLNMGRNMSIEAGINYGPANDALLLAAGYISDLYTILGNEAWAEANNPTVNIGDNTGLRNIATSLFPFLGETATLMEQQQALLRGRDDFLTPGTRRAPVYNRLYWNYTRGINSGEIIYALHYNIKPAPNNITGNVGAADAAYLFPQGHGDAYGHYLTALFNYYKLLMNPSFSWVPTSEAVTILDTPVAVSYMHERKFAQSAATLARTGQLIFDLAWREAYIPGSSNGWAFLSPSYQNVNVTAGTDGATSKRYWGADHWASKVGQANYLNWVVGNSLLPDFDPDPLHFGIQKVDRGTVTELSELPRFSSTLQTGVDNAEAHLNPLGLPENTVTFDINPNLLTGVAPQSHFEQIYARAADALGNAAFAFNQGQDVTQALRGQQDLLAEYIDKINTQEQAFTNQLIEIFGTPYSDDIGPGGTYAQGYQGPDVAHFAYVDQTDVPNAGGVLGFADPITGEAADPFTTGQMTVPFFNQPIFEWMTDAYLVDYSQRIGNPTNKQYQLQNLYRPPGGANVQPDDYLYVTIDTEGYIQKPSEWTGKRTYSGKIQRAIMEYKTAYWEYVNAGNTSVGGVQEFGQKISRFSNFVEYQVKKAGIEGASDDLSKVMVDIDLVNKLFSQDAEALTKMIEAIGKASEKAFPLSAIFGLAMGGDLMSAGRALLAYASIGAEAGINAVQLAVSTSTLIALGQDQKKLINYQKDLRKLDADLETVDYLEDIITATAAFTDAVVGVNLYARKLNLAEANVQTAVQEGYQLLATRTSYRTREAAIIHGFRTRDASYRLFQNEKLERYNTLFNLAQRYALLAAYAYDYETGLLGTDAGKKIISQLVGTRSLGVVDSNGKPQFVGEGAGDAGLSSALAAIWADWGVLKGRLGFNNPDGYGTMASLRSENFRILPDASGESAWQDLLNRSRTSDLLADPDVRRNCLGIDKGNGLRVPGLVVSFSTTVAEGYNLFGKTLAPGDHNFSESSFATKIFSVGVALDGYLGMDPPSANMGALGATGGSSPSDPTTFTDPNALAATPYVYLIPVGVDSMRSPPLGDVSTVRSWEVADLAIPIPFNLGASGFSTKPLWQSSDSLQEPLFAVRKHQAFRPVPSASYFNASIYGGNNGLQRTQFANSRLIGRSVWNSQWKLVIPGSALLNNSEEGLDRFIKSVKDVKVYFITYSYSGN